MNYQNNNGYNNVPPPPPNYNYNQYPKKDNTLRTVLIVIGAVFAFLFFLGFFSAIFGGSDEKQTAKKSVRPDTMTTAELSWCGRMSSDEMTDVKTYEAMMKSDSKDSDSAAMDVCIKKKGNKTIVTLDIDSYSSSVSTVGDDPNNMYCLVRKDESKALECRFVQNELLSSSAKLLHPEEFIQYVKDAKTLRIQIGLSGAKHIFRFRPSNKLIWPPTPETYGDGNGDWKMM